MPHIPLREKCEETCAKGCPYRDCDTNCLDCQSHCPCCTGPQDGICRVCNEPDCDNRNQPFEPATVSESER